MLGLSLLKTRRHIVLKVGDPDWISTRIDRIAAYCNGYTKLRGRRNQTTPLLGEAEDGWRTTSVYKTITIRPKGEDRLQECVVGKDNVAYHNDKLNTIMDSICNQCNNHCTACVYDCQIRYDDEEYEVENVVDDNIYEVGNSDEVLDNHRPLSQTGCKPTVRKCDEPCSLLRSKSGKKSLRKKRRCVVGGDKITDPMWPAVLLTFERGISESFRETHKAEIAVY